jgi:hypothetical protein
MKKLVLAVALLASFTASGGYCMYVFRWTYLIDKYNLSANQVDKDKIREVIVECDLN